MGKLGVIDVKREEEFAPVKNADLPDKLEVDSPSSARDMLLTEASKWLTAAGFELKPEAENKIEISFSLTYRGNELIGQNEPTEIFNNIKKSLEGKTTFSDPGYIDEKGNFHKCYMKK